MSMSSWTVESSGINGTHIVTEKQNCDDNGHEGSLSSTRANRWSGASSDEPPQRTSAARVTQARGDRRQRNQLDPALAEFESGSAVTRRKRTDVKTLGDDSMNTSLDVSQRSDVFDEGPNQYRRPQWNRVSVSEFESDTAVTRRKRGDVKTVGDDSRISSMDVSQRSEVFDEDPNQYRRSDRNSVWLPEFETDAAVDRRSRASVKSVIGDGRVPLLDATKRSEVFGEDPNQTRRSTVDSVAPAEVKRRATGARKNRFGQQPSDEGCPQVSTRGLFDTFKSWQDSSSAPDAYLQSDNIQKLNISNFSDFIRGMEKTLVMFYLPASSDTKKPASEFAKVAEKPHQENHAFAVVDCLADTRLCFREKAINLPVMKLYSNGFDLSTISDVHHISADQMHTLIKMTPVLNQPRETLAKVYVKRR